MMTRYRLDPRQSRFTAQAFATGLLSAFGHSPTFAVSDFQGTVHLDPDAPETADLEVAVRANALTLLDRVSVADRTEIERRMRDEVLQTQIYPEVRYEARQVRLSPAGARRFRLRIMGSLSLHGVTRAAPLDAELHLFDDGLRLLGNGLIHMSDHGIRPVSALGGSIKLKPEVQVVFEVVGLPEDA